MQSTYTSHLLIESELGIKMYMYRRWGDKTSYLKYVKCSGEQKNMAALTL